MPPKKSNVGLPKNEKVMGAWRRHHTRKTQAAASRASESHASTVVAYFLSLIEFEIAQPDNTSPPQRGWPVLNLIEFELPQAGIWSPSQKG